MLGQILQKDKELITVTNLMLFAVLLSKTVVEITKHTEIYLIAVAAIIAIRTLTNWLTIALNDACDPIWANSYIAWTYFSHLL